MIVCIASREDKNQPTMIGWRELWEEWLEWWRNRRGWNGLRQRCCRGRRLAAHEDVAGEVLRCWGTVALIGRKHQVEVCVLDLLLGGDLVTHHWTHPFPLLIYNTLITTVDKELMLPNICLIKIWLSNKFNVYKCWSWNWIGRRIGLGCKLEKAVIERLRGWSSKKNLKFQFLKFYFSFP